MKIALVASVHAALLLMVPFSASADTIPLTLSGTLTSVDIWGPGTLTGAANPGYGAFPGGGLWPAPIQSPTGGDAFLRKIDNGPGGGGPYPSGSGLYFGGFGSTPNTDGGSLAVVDSTPVLDVKTVTFQIQIGQAFGYDLLNNDLSLVKLHYTTTDGGSGELSSDYGSLLNRFYNGAVDMPTGPGGAFQPEDIYVNLWGLQWDLSGISNINWFEIQFTGVEHASLAQLQLDQTNAAYDESAFPQDPVWTAGGGDSNWSTASNWQEGTPATAGQNASLSSGTEVVLDTDRTIGALNLSANDGFELKSTNGSVLTVNTGINGTAATESSYTISSAVHMADYNLIDLNANNDLTISGAITGAGFYKQGEGSLYLTGNNVYDSNNSDLATNGLMIRGGTNYISGTNTLSGDNSINFKVRQDTTVVLHGGDNRLDSKFMLKLMAGTSKLVLGDGNGRSDLTVAGVGEGTFENVVSGSKIVGGGADVSTFTVDGTGAYNFGGNLGGAGANENNVAFTKKGTGVQILSGTNTHTGDTRIEGGLLQYNGAAAFSANSNVKVDGGVIGVGAGNLNANLGSGAGQIQFTGDGGFAASGENRSVTLNGGAGLTWGEGGFVGNNNKLILSYAAGDQDRTVDFTNTIALGSANRTVQVNNSSTNVDARLSGVVSGDGGFNKTGTGALEMTAANTYTGGTTVAEGTLSLAGVDGSVRGDVNVATGATLQLVNTATANNADRLADTGKVSLNGSILTVSNPTSGSAVPAYSETFGELTLNKGANVINTSRTAANVTNALRIGSLTRTAGATVNFTAGSTLGLDTSSQIIFNNAPTLSNGMIGGWATVGNDFASYGTYGVATVYYSAGVNQNVAQTAWHGALNLKIAPGSSTAGTTLTANRQLNSLNLTGTAASAGTVGNIVNLSGYTLQVQTGGILTSGGAATRVTQINNGNLTAGSGADAELIVTSNGVTSIGANIVDNGAGKVALVKAGTNILTLSANNTYSGSTTVNQGTLIIAGTHTGGAGVTVQRNATLTVNGSLAVNGAVDISGTVGGTGSFVYGSGSSLTGSGSVNLAVTVGSAAGQLATLSPGNSPGTMTFGANQTWADGGTYVWEVKDVDLGAGLGWDTIAITGSLNIDISDTPFVIDITSLTATNAAGLVPDFDLGTDYTWTILTTTAGITGFDADSFDLRAANFANAPGGAFSISQVDNSLVLNYAAVPEPSTWLLMALGGCLVLFLRRRRSSASA